MPSTTSPLVVDQQQVLDADLPEAHADRIDPEVVGALGVARGDVAGGALGEAEPPEEAEGGGQSLLSIPALLFHALELREGVRRALGWHTTSVGRLYRSVHRMGTWTSP